MRFKEIWFGDRASGLGLGVSMENAKKSHVQVLWLLIQSYLQGFRSRVSRILRNSQNKESYVCLLSPRVKHQG